ncbi:MAG TPA: hypothetical protein ENI86_16620 [Acidimicrobiales bacterium]|nr:hypothetical protein [Acidimicrobiales bacterium]
MSVVDTEVEVYVLVNDFFPTDYKNGSLKLVSGPSGGSAIVNSSGNPASARIRYSRVPGIPGTDSFAYEVCDRNGTCDTATVSVTISG